MAAFTDLPHDSGYIPYSPPLECCRCRTYSRDNVLKRACERRAYGSCEGPVIACDACFAAKQHAPHGRISQPAFLFLQLCLQGDDVHLCANRRWSQRGAALLRWHGQAQLSVGLCGCADLRSRDIISILYHASCCPLALFRPVPLFAPGKLPLCPFAGT